MREALLTVCAGIIRWPSRTLGGVDIKDGWRFQQQPERTPFLKCRGAARHTAIFLITPPGCWM